MKRFVFPICLILVFIAGFSSFSFSAETENNEEFSKLVMPELMIGLGTRATALGGMAVAVTNDLNSLYWNPAGLSRLKGLEFEFIHNTWLVDISRETLLFGSSAGEEGTVAFGVNYLGLGTIEKTLINGDGTIGLTDEKLTLFALGAYLGWGMTVMPGMGAGATVKFNMEELGTTSQISIAADMGMQYQVWNDLRLGLVVRNLGMNVKGFDLPLTGVIGSAWQIKLLAKSSILIGVDYEIPFAAGSQSLIHTGMEFSYADIVAIRVGYQISDINAMGGMAGLTVGLGLELGGWEIGYTFAPQGDLGTSHRISLGVNVTRLGEMQKAGARAKKKQAAKKRAKRAVYLPGMGFKTKQKSVLPVVTGAVSAISQEETAMRSLLSGGLKVDVKVRNIMVKGKREREFAFKIKRSSGARVKQWKLSIIGAKDKVLRTLTGEGLRKLIVWDGKNESRRKVKGKAVNYQLSLTDINGKQETVKSRIVLSGKKVNINSETDKGGKTEVRPEPILFDKKRAEITPAAAMIIAEAAKVIHAHPSVKIYVQGYADGVEEKSDALVLSKARAEAVARYLTAYHKVAINKILVRGRGSKHPAVSNANAKLRHKNRRVTVVIKGTK